MSSYYASLIMYAFGTMSVIGLTGVVAALAFLFIRGVRRGDF